MNRERKDGYVVSDKGQAFGDLLYFLVVKLDTGTPPYEIAKEVEAIGRAMGR